MLFANTRINRGIRPEYNGPTAIADYHYSIYSDWRDDEPVPSHHFNVGRLVVPPTLLRRAADEAAALKTNQSVTLRTENSKAALESELRGDGLPPFLQAFLHVCAARFDQMVQEDVRYYVPSQAAYDNVRYLTGVDAGAYELAADSTWHRDSADPGDITYLLTLAGPCTRFARGDYKDDQFTGANREMLDGTPPASEQVVAAPGIITVHDGTFTVHKAPPAEFNGDTRIFLHSSVYGVFDRPG